MVSNYPSWSYSIWRGDGTVEGRAHPLRLAPGEKAGEGWVGPGMQVGTHATCLKGANQLVKAGRLDRRV